MQVNTRRSRCDNKNEGPTLNDTLGKLRGIGGRFQKVLAERGFTTGEHTRVRGTRCGGSAAWCGSRVSRTAGKAAGPLPAGSRHLSCFFHAGTSVYFSARTGATFRRPKLFGLQLCSGRLKCVARLYGVGPRLTLSVPQPQSLGQPPKKHVFLAYVFIGMARVARKVYPAKLPFIVHHQPAETLHSAARGIAIASFHGGHSTNVSA